MSMASSPRSRCQRDHSTFSTEARAGSSMPRVSSAYSRMSRRPIQARASRSRISGSPDAPLRRAASARSSKSRRNPTCWPSMAAPRSMASVALATRQPSPGAPTTLAAAVRASSKKTSLNSAVPVICRIGRTVIPGWSIGTSR